MPNMNDRSRGKFDPAIEEKRLRDQFAGRAMEALLSDLKFIHESSRAMGCTPADYVAITAWDIADSMMKKRGEIEFIQRMGCCDPRRDQHYWLPYRVLLRAQISPV